MNAITVRGCTIGTGIPKICVPIVAATIEEIAAQAQALAGKSFDVVEWRADWFDGVFQPDAVRQAARQLRAVLGEAVPLLFTFRTRQEGGEKAISAPDYIALNHLVASEHLADLIDVELFTGDAAVQCVASSAHAAGVPVIVSNHDFHQTPAQEELVSRLCRAEQLGGDILKIAVMPQTRADVLTLLSATEEMSRRTSCPLITMSMGTLGVVSRLCGETFGCALTFGTAGQASAPGQIDTESLHSVLELLHGC